MNWFVELLDLSGEPYRMLGSTILATRETRDKARETGKWFVENDATVSGFRIGKVVPRTGE